MVHVPIVRRKPWGIICLIMNFLPIGGIGTMMAASNQENTRWFTYGVIQMVGIFILLPWSWVSGILIFIKSE